MKSGQVWIETVLYTLIGLSIIGVILAMVRPAIEEKRDAVTLQQAIDILKGIDNNIADVIQYGTGNSREVEISLRKGQMLINSTGNELYYSTESTSMFSEPGAVTNVAKNIKALTTERAKKKYFVEFRMRYSMNLTFTDKDIVKSLPASSTPYNLVITNKGNYIDFSLA